MRQFEGDFASWENYTLQHSVLKKINVRTPTTIKKLNDIPDPPSLDPSCLSSTEAYFM